MKPVYRLPYFDIARRRHGQCGIDPPGTYRDAIARSAPPATAAIRSGRTSGSCERSASIWQMTSYPRAIPIAKPARYALPSPRFSGRRSTSIWPSSAATRSAMSAVPSGLLSSRTRMSASGSAARPAAGTPRCSPPRCRWACTPGCASGAVTPSGLGRGVDRRARQHRRVAAGPPRAVGAATGLGVVADLVVPVLDVHRPHVVVGAEDVVDREDGRHHRVVLVVVLVHAVAPRRHQVWCVLGDPVAQDRDVVLVVLVVDGIRLRHPHHVAGLDLARVGQAELLELTLALLDELLV